MIASPKGVVNFGHETHPERGSRKVSPEINIIPPGKAWGSDYSTGRRLEEHDEKPEKKDSGSTSSFKSISSKSRRSTLRFVNFHYNGQDSIVSRWNMQYSDPELEARFQQSLLAPRISFITYSYILWFAGTLIVSMDDRLNDDTISYKVALIGIFLIACAGFQVIVLKTTIKSMRLVQGALLTHLIFFLLWSVVKESSMGSSVDLLLLHTNGSEVLTEVAAIQHPITSLERQLQNSLFTAVSCFNATVKDSGTQYSGVCINSFTRADAEMVKSILYQISVGILVQFFAHVSFREFTLHQLATIAIILVMERHFISNTDTWKLMSLLISFILCVLSWKTEHNRRQVFLALHLEKSSKETAQSEAKRAQHLVTTLKAERERQQQTVETVMKNSTGVRLESLQLRYSDIQFGEPIGKGTFGKVYCGELRGESVAVKSLSPEKLNVDLVHLFRTEIEMMSLFRHPNIICMYGACWDEGLDQMCIVLEYAARGTLEEVLTQGNYSWARELSYMMLGTARGLAYLHHGMDKSCVHRDLKPENILIGSSFQAKVSDFGSAALVPTADLRKPRLSGSVGSPLWTPPEVLKGEKYDGSVDVYAFGLILLEALADDGHYLRNHFPCQGDLVMRVLDGYRPPIPEKVAENFPDMVSLVEECWSEDPAKRPSFITICKLFEAGAQSVRSFGIRTANSRYLTTRISSVDTHGLATDQLVSEDCKSQQLVDDEVRMINPSEETLYTKQQLQDQLAQQSEKYEEQMEDMRQRYERRLARVAQVIL